MPFFYPMWGNTHYSMLSFFGSEKTKTENARPQNNKKSLYLNKNIRNWDKSLQYLPFVFINTPFLPYVGIIHTIACFRSSAPKKTKTENARPQNNKKVIISQ